MRNKTILCIFGSSLLLTASAVRGGDPAVTNSASAHGGKFPPHRESLLPPNIMEKLNLTDDQKTNIKTITDKFEKNRDEYVAAHRSEMDAARAAMQEASKSDDQAKKKAAREQMAKATAG